MKLTGLLLIVAVFAWWKLRRPLIAPIKHDDGQMSNKWLIQHCYDEGKDGDDQR